MGAVVAEQLDRAHIEFDERPRGLYRVPAVDGEVLIALVDVCEDASVFSEPSASARVIFVLGNALDYRRRLPSHCLVFRLIDLVLGEATPVFLREIRDLLRQASRILSAPGPAIARVAPPTPRGPPAIATVSSSNRAAVSVPDGTSWSEVTIYLVDGETIAVQVGGQRLQRYRHYQLGMSDRRSGKPCKKWRILEQLCENYGSFPWAGAPSEFGAFKERVSGLRRTLQRAFGIAANPIPTCSRRHGLRAAFRAFPDLDNEPLFETRT
jgi:hypothetical protein